MPPGAWKRTKKLIVGESTLTFHINLFLCENFLRQCELISGHATGRNYLWGLHLRNSSVNQTSTAFLRNRDQYHKSGSQKNWSLLGRGGCNRSRENPGIAKISLIPPPAPQSWHTDGFHDKKCVNSTRDNCRQGA